MTNNKTSKTGTFIANYQIGESIPGGVIFHANFIVNATNGTVTGAGRITQAINPPLDIKTTLHGDYTYMTVMPKNSHILVTATGYPNVKFPAGGGIGPVILSNCELRMVLASDWKSGVANYKYCCCETGEFKEVNNAKVTLLNNQQFELNAEAVKAAEEECCKAANSNKASKKNPKKAFG